MLGMFGLLNLGAQSLQVQQQGVEVTSHNLANVNNPAYARQRVEIQTAPTIPTPLGPQGTGAQVAGIRQLRNLLVDQQIQAEISVRSFLEAQQTALQFGQALLGQAVDRLGSGPESSPAALAVGGHYGLSEGLADLFAAFQALATDPASLTERQNVLVKAEDLAQRFNLVDTRLGELHTSLNNSIQVDVAKVNELLTTIAALNKEIFAAENGIPGTANDLRDSRLQKVEELAGLVSLHVAEQSNGTLDISLDGVVMVSGTKVLDQLETYDAGAGQLLVRTVNNQTTLNLASGRIPGTILARDGALQTLRQEINTLAGNLIAEINALHQTGYSLAGSTGAPFFFGSNAADIQINGALRLDPALIQASGTSGAVGDNSVALALAQLANQSQLALGSQTYSQHFAQTVAGLGSALRSLNTRLADQTLIESMLLRQRDSVSGVSLDEEMTNLIRFQKAFEASARLITTVDEMLQTVLAMKR